MLGAIRKFSNTIYAKIVLFIIAIPFVFWGMGDLFRGGSQNTIVKIGDEKISKNEFINYVKVYSSAYASLDENVINDLLNNFIAYKLISKEVEYFNIKLSDKSLKKIITNKRNFKRDNIFSRTEYEKFLIANNLNAATYEKTVVEQEKKFHLLNFIGSGIKPSLISINLEYDSINQERLVHMINLDEAFSNQLLFTEKEIESHFNSNKEKYKDIYKHINYIKLNPKNLTTDNEFSDLFFKKIDEIDDLIVNGVAFDQILKKFNLDSFSTINLNKDGLNKNATSEKSIPPNLIKNVFNIDKSQPVILLQSKDSYFIIELIKTEAIYKKISEAKVKSDVIINLKNIEKRKLIANLIGKINENKFSKIDFDQFAKEKNVSKKILKFTSRNDDKALKKEIINQVYSYPEKKVIIVADLEFKESYLVYIEEIKRATINKNSKKFEEYSKITKARYTNNIYNTYDTYLKKKYKININYQALDSIINNFK